MKIKIIDIVKRPWWQRIFTVNYWRVTVEDEEGTRYTLNAWAGVGHPNTDSLKYDIKTSFRRRGGRPLSEAKGMEFVV